MKAEDTVMNPTGLGLAVADNPDIPMGQAIAKAQAEISFKAGYDKALAQLADMTEECKQIGRKEVAGWVDNNIAFANIPVSWKGWQAFKKEKGIE